MPFDSLPDGRRSYLLKKLDVVSYLLSDEQKWCQNRLRRPDGARCLVGALKDAKARLVLYRPMLNAARAVTGVRYYRLEWFNDAADTHFSIVQAALDKARIDIAMGELPTGPVYAMQYRIALALEKRPIARMTRLARYATVSCARAITGFH